MIATEVIQLTMPRVIAYSAIGAWVESGVKMMTASPGDSLSIASLSMNTRMSHYYNSLGENQYGQASGSALSSSG